MPYAQSNPQPDFRVTYHGTITTITQLSDACRDWLEDNVAIEPWQRFGDSIAVEPRYVEQLAEAMIGEGRRRQRQQLGRLPALNGFESDFVLRTPRATWLTDSHLE